MALLVIDVQLGLFKKNTPLYRATEILANINTLIERSRAAGIPVIYVQHCNDSFLTKDTPDWQLHPDLIQPIGDELRISKHHGSSFEGTLLEQELDRRGVGSLTLAGLVTHGCVKAACLDACALGYRVTLAADGHSSFSKDAPRLIEEWNARLEQAGARVIPVANIDFVTEMPRA